jgi:hypothetical protein
MRWVVGLVASALVVLACARSDTFACETDEQCQSPQTAGVCVMGYCAFVDPRCESGLRFGELAGNLSGTCVPANDSVGATDGTTGAPSTTTDTTSGPSSTSTAGSTSSPSTTESTSTTSASTETSESETTGPTDWWDPEFAYRIELRIDPGVTDGDLTDFPYLVAWAANADLVGETEPDGADLRFVHGDEILPHEIEAFESETGRLAAWVGLAALSSSETTVLHLYFGNPSAQPTDPTAVWDADFAGVWHFDSALDSTENENHGDTQGTTSVPGRVGHALHFDGASSRVVVPDGPGLAPATAHTMSAWVHIADEADFAENVAPIFVRGTTFGSSSADNAFFLRLAHSYLDYGLKGEANNCGTYWAGYGARLTGGWHHVAATWDGATMVIYGDGVAVENAVCSEGLEVGQHPVSMGGYATGSELGLSTRTLLGDLDEVRFSGVARTTTWIGASYRNQNDPTAHLEVDPAEAAP